MLEPFAQALTPQLSEQLSNLKASPKLQARIDELAEKCNEGGLTDSEQAEYDAFVRAGNLINIIRAKAKKARQQNS